METTTFSQYPQHRTMSQYLDPLLAAFIKATDRRYEDERKRRSALMVGARDKLIAACVTAKEKTPAPTEVRIRLPIVAADKPYFTDLADRIREVMDFPADDRVCLMASVHRTQQCNPNCVGDYGECGCPWVYFLVITLKRLRE